MLDKSMFRPEDGPVTVDEIVEQTVAFANQARKAYGLEPERVLIMTIPYDPARRESWTNAETAMSTHPLGRYIKFDWTSWNVWTIPRGEHGGVPAEWLVRTGEGNAIIPQWTIEPLSAAQLRDLAAEAMAVAALLEDAENGLAIEGGL